MLLARALAPGLALFIACALPVAVSPWAGTWWRRALTAAGFPLALATAGVAGVSEWVWLAPLALLLCVYPLGAWRDAPLFPTPHGALERLRGAAILPQGAPLLDAGCGLGDGLIALRKAYPQAQLHGLERSGLLTALCTLRCPWARIRRGDIWATTWAPYAMVYLFQRPESMARALAKAQAEMAAGSWLVSLEFSVPGLEADAEIPLPKERSVWLYRIAGAQKTQAGKLKSA